ncbi:MAG: hypothetical protein GOU99_01880 [Candidatus Altiarchaeota archaeon]|nr:hypothetical protein [Candidatus Altiarchaeota archaeon]
MSGIHWAFNDVRWDHEGWYIPELYKVFKNTFRDIGYAIDEHRYSHAFTPEGKEQGVAGIWILHKEVDKKYSMIKVQLNFKFNWSLVPKPGSDPENPQLLPKGTARISAHGFVQTDFASKWLKSPLLRPFWDLKDRYFYKKRTNVFIDLARSDIETGFEKIQDYLNFLPKVE